MMITPQDIELIAMVLQRASVNPIEAQWINAKLDELRRLVKEQGGGSQPPVGATPPAGA